MADRQKGIQVHRPIIYGSHSRLLTEAERATAPPQHTHRWTVFLASATSPPPPPGQPDEDTLPGGLDDLSYLVKKVTFRLHETYNNPSRVCDKPPFKVVETGWGEFTVQIRVQFIQEANEKPINLAHGIKLHHWGAPIEAPPLVTLPVPIADTPAPPAEDAVPVSRTTLGAEETEVVETGAISPTPAGGDASGSGPIDQPAPSEDDTVPKIESQTPTGVKPVEDPDVKMEVTTPLPQSQSQPQNPEAGTGTGTEPPSTPAPAPPNAETTQPPPQSIATRLPVHAWQYDELVFSDPPLAFLNILNAHPPTPLPAKNRRPRDQRELVTGNTAKKKKGRVSEVARSVSRAATAEVGSSGEGEVIVAAARGIAGEPGSADVPLEFSAEMEKGEWNKLQDARRKIVDEMDRWRTRLIEQEKELAKVKEEMRL